MSPIGIVVYALVLPWLVAAVTLVVKRAALRFAGIAGGDHAATALAIGLGYLAGHLALALPAYPPIEVTDRIPWIAAVAVVLGLLESTHPGPAWTRWENRLILGAIVLGAVLGPLFGGLIECRAGLNWLAVLGVALLASWSHLEALAARPALLGPSLLIATAGAGVALLVSGSLVLGQFGLGLAASIAAVLILSRRAPGPALGRGAVPVVTAVAGSLLIVGYVYSGLPASVAATLAASPLAAWAGALGPIRRRPAWQASLASAVATLLVVGIALGLAIAASPADDGYGY